MTFYDNTYDTYGDFCKEQSSLNPIEWCFKSHPNFTYMTEHVNQTQGNHYFTQIGIEFGNFLIQNQNYLLKCIEENDKYGKTIKHDYPNFISCSSTNMRYIYQSLKICEYIKSLKLNEIDFIEIGAGYGGLCYYLHKLSTLFDIKIISYSIFDLKKPALLTNKYLKSLNINNVNNYTLEDIDNITLKTDNFLISSYAFSELIEENRNEYQKLLIEPYVSHGFIAWNSIKPYNFTKNSNIRVIDTFYTLNMNQAGFPYVIF